MRIKELIKVLQKIDDKNRNIQILIGNEDDDSLCCEVFDLMHVNDKEHCIEIFCHIKDCCVDIFPNSKIIIDNK